MKGTPPSMLPAFGFVANTNSYLSAVLVNKKWSLLLNKNV